MANYGNSMCCFIALGVYEDIQCRLWMINDKYITGDNFKFATTVRDWNRKKSNLDIDL